MNCKYCGGALTGVERVCPKCGNVVMDDSGVGNNVVNTTMNSNTVNPPTFNNQNIVRNPNGVLNPSNNYQFYNNQVSNMAQSPQNVATPTMANNNQQGPYQATINQMTPTPIDPMTVAASTNANMQNVQAPQQQIPNMPVQNNQTTSPNEEQKKQKY